MKARFPASGVLGIDGQRREGTTLPMADLDKITEDFSTTPVPAEKTVSGLRIALILIGVSIALPAFLTGVQIGDALGLKSALIAFVAGGLILAAVSSFAAIVGAESHFSTYMLVQFAFGSKGARIVNAVFTTTLFGWFGVNAALFGDAMTASVSSLYNFTGGWPVYVVIGSLLMVLTTLFGFKALDRLSQLAVPLLLLILIGVMAMAVRQANPDALFAEGPRTMSLGLAISAVAGGIMVGAATMPDLTRYAKSRKGAVIAMFVAYGLGAPLILACAAIPSLVTGEKDLMQIILGLGLGVPALFVLIFSTWTSNAANLYSAGLSLAATFKRIRPWRLTLSAGILGIVVALSGIIDFFVPFLISLGVLIPPIAAIYVVDFLFVVRRRYDLKDIDTRPAFRWQAFVSWIAGSAVGFATAKGVLTLTTISACDALIVSGGVFYLLERYGPRAD